MAQVNIKPNRIKFIAALKETLKRIEDERLAYHTSMDEYKKARMEWAKTADLSLDNIKESQIDFTSVGTATKIVRVVVKKLPAGLPKRPAEPALKDWEAQDAIVQLKSVIAMLELTDEETVSASVANKVSQFLIK